MFRGQSTVEYVSLFVTVNVNFENVAILGRQARKRYPGLLRPPGGAVCGVADLSLALASLREFTEETGIEQTDLLLNSGISKIYSIGNDQGVFTLFGMHCNMIFTNKEITNLITSRHADAKCPDELTEIVTIPLYDLLNTPSVRYDLAPDFRAEISVEPTASLFNKYIENLA